jgi:alanine racemase
MTAAQIDKTRVRTWIEVDTRALAANYSLIRGLIPAGCRLMAVAKSNAYGHGIYDYVPAVERLGADWLGVDSIVEAATLREIGVRKPILVLGYTLPGRIGEAAGLDISLTVSSFDGLEAFGRSPHAGNVRIHIKIDTGLHRQGFLTHQLPELVRVLKRSHPTLTVEGVFTHFAAAKDPDDPAYTRAQIKSFEKALAMFRSAGYAPIAHASATAGIFLYPEACFDMVRVGIGLFGLWPSPKMKAAYEGRTTLEPTLSWRTIISETKRLPMGAGIGYDLTENLARDSVVGICPVGYWHGYPRALSRKGNVLVNGRRARVIGTVAMDMIVIDLTDVPGARAEDTVTLLGRDGKEEITAYEMAAAAGQSYYELLTRLNPLIQKYYLPG